MSDTPTPLLSPFICAGGANLAEPAVLSFLGGTAVAWCCGSPTKHKVNADALGVILWGSDLGVLAVSDGIGGLPHAPEASARVIGRLAQPLAAGEADPVQSRIMDINQTMCRENYQGGATISAVLLEGLRCASSHVGDSMLVVVDRRGRVKFRTDPHSPVGDAVAHGQLSEQAAMRHPQRHVVNNSVGSRAMWVETHQSFALDASDTLVIASDGLWDNLPVSEVVQMVVDGDLGEVGHSLAAAVSQRMVGAEPGMPSKPDDLSFILFSRAGSN